MNKLRSESLENLKSLVNDLSDRDTQLKKDMQLFEEFFETFPIPVTMWSISAESTLLSKRGNGFICHKASCLDDLFLSDKVKELSIKSHARALEGARVDYFARTEDSVFYVKLLPRHDENKEICGVTGVSWDVTSNAIILACLEDIAEKTEGRRGDYKKINNMTTRALLASRLRGLLMQDEEE
jgi:hypothetical protein